MEAASQLQPPLAQVDLTGHLGFGAVEVIGVNGERPGEKGAVADQDAAALERLKQPFVRIEVTESARSMPASSVRPFGVSAAKPP